jgi:hypothetical protein
LLSVYLCNGGPILESLHCNWICVPYRFFFFLFLFFLGGGGQRPLVPLLLLGPPFFPIILFASTTLLNRMTGNSCNGLLLLSCMAVSLKENNWFFVMDQTPRPVCLTVTMASMPGKAEIRTNGFPILTWRR